MQNNYTFILDKNTKKGICPKCGKSGKFQYYKNLPQNYGRCERINSCGYHNKPNNESPETIKELNKMVNQTLEYKTVAPEPTIIYPEKNYIDAILKNQNSNFHKFCINTLKITPEHLTNWGVGAENDYTCFVLQNKKKVLNLKKTFFFENCKRDKKINPLYLIPKKGTKYLMCLFGEHLLSDKIVCLVESEKTAVIASYFYPQFDWLATGGSSGLSVDKVQVLLKKQVYYLPDADNAGRKNATLDKLKKYNVAFKIVDLYPERMDGYDLADAIIEGLNPEIKPNITETKAITLPIKDDKPKNNFTILRDYMLETWDFQYNLIRNEIEYKFKTNTDFIILNDADVYIYLRENNIQFKKEDFTAILRSSIMESYNPIEKYFKSLNKWNNEIDFIDKLVSYLKYSGNIDIKTHFKKWLVRAVKCAINDKYFNKQIFVLIGKQNDGKSTFVRFLVPDELEKYYTENPDFKNKDGEISLTQNFIINMDELANIGKEDTDKLKTFISKVSTNVRRPYEKNTRPEPRKASFMGTTNNDEFLTDHTGNVRWLNFKIDSIDFNYSKEININDVWAQAYYLFENGFDCEISKYELEEVEKSNQDFKIQTQEMQAIKEYFVIPYAQDSDRIKFMTANDIINHLETINPRYKNLNNYKIGNAMTSLGYKRDNQRKDKYTHPVKGYWVYFNTQ